jgi:hypothetical protein
VLERIFRCMPYIGIITLVTTSTFKGYRKAIVLPGFNQQNQKGINIEKNKLDGT